MGYVNKVGSDLFGVLICLFEWHLDIKHLNRGEFKSKLGADNRQKPGASGNSVVN